MQCKTRSPLEAFALPFVFAHSNGRCHPTIANRDKEKECPKSSLVGKASLRTFLLVELSAVSLSAQEGVAACLPMPAKFQRYMAAHCFTMK